MYHFIFGAAIVSLLAVTSCDALRRELYPNPITMKTSCWRDSATRPDGFFQLCDPDQLVSSEQAKSLQIKLSNIRKGTPCPCRRIRCHIDTLERSKDRRGYTVSVALVKTMSDRDNMNNVTRAQSYANYLRTNRGYFDRQFQRCEEDIIVFVSLEDHVVYILTGGQARQKVTDRDLERMIIDSREQFRQSIFFGLESLLNKLKEKLH